MFSYAWIPYNDIMLKRTYIEISNVCNLECAFCRKSSRPKRIMTPAEFQHVLCQVKQITSYVYLHVQGEPLLHPQFEEIIDLCDREQVQVQLVTNGSLLKDHMALGRHPSLRKISISLQSIEYQQCSIEEYMTTVIRFCRICSIEGRPICELRFWREDQKDLLRTRTCLEMLQREFDMVPDGRKNNYRLLPGVYAEFDNSFEWPSGAPASDRECIGTCHGGIDQIAILSDGTVVPCCLDCEGHIRLGNLFDTNLQEILQSSRYLELVDGFQRHRVVEPFCRACTYRLRFK